jgi:hypothetical protein
VLSVCLVRLRLQQALNGLLLPTVLPAAGCAAL